MRRARRPRAGFTLIEVLAALVIFGSALVVLLSLSAACSRAVTAAEQRERHLARADALLSTAALWPRADLDRHLGERAEGAFVLLIQRPLPDLYLAAVRDSGADRPPLLSTSLYRSAAR